jgi:hypothetical protein
MVEERGSHFDPTLLDLFLLSDALPRCCDIRIDAANEFAANGQRTPTPQPR